MSTITEFQSLSTYAPKTDTEVPLTADLKAILVALQQTYDIVTLRAMLTQMMTHIQDINSGNDPHHDAALFEDPMYALDSLYKTYLKNDTDGLYLDKATFKRQLFTWLWVDPRTEKTEWLPADVAVGFDEMTNEPNEIYPDEDTLTPDTFILFESDVLFQNGAVTTRIFGIDADNHNHKIHIHDNLKPSFLGQMVLEIPSISMSTIMIFGEKVDQRCSLMVEDGERFVGDISVGGKTTSTYHEVVFLELKDDDVSILKISQDPHAPLNINIVLYPDDLNRRETLVYSSHEGWFRFVLRSTSAGIIVLDKDQVLTTFSTLPSFTHVSTTNSMIIPDRTVYVDTLDIYPIPLQNVEIEKILGGVPV